MRTRSLPLLCALALLLWLGACTRQAPAPSQAPETPPATPEPAAKYDFKILPVTEEGIRTLYGWEGYEVRRITPFCSSRSNICVSIGLVNPSSLPSSPVATVFVSGCRSK